MLYTNDSCCNVDLLIFYTGFLSVCWVSTRAEDFLSHSAESRMHSPLWRLWGSTSLFTGIAAGASPNTQMQVRTQRLSQPPFILYKIVFFSFPSYMFIYGLKTQFFSSGNFFLDYFSTSPSLLLLFYLELVLFSYGILWALLKFCCYYFPIFFLSCCYTFWRFPQLTTFLLSFSFLLLFMFISPPEYSFF